MLQQNLRLFFALLVLAPLLSLPVGAAPKYSWIKTISNAQETLSDRITPPPGFQRVPAEPGSYASWLRGLPMKEKGAAVHLHTGKLKFNQFAHWDVVDIDVGKRDLQQCADAIMRLRGEYLYAQGRLKDIAFNFTNGKRVAFTRRYRNRGYKSFRKYMNLIFAYAGTYSLSKELKPVSTKQMAIGDLFIKGGFPGHAILVADMVENPGTGEKRFLLLQSFMPAQEMHILRNPANAKSPWYPLNFGETLVTPEWTFNATQLMRFPSL